MKATFLRGITWLKYGWRYSAPLNPFRLVWIDPNEIQRYPKIKPPTLPWLPSAVLGGDWDRQLKWFENGIVFRSFRNRFIKKKNWTDTVYHTFAIEMISENGHYKGYSKPNELKQRYKKLDELFNNISEYGYQTQRELDSIESLSVHRHLHLPPEMREVTVDISRSGKMLWRGGAHRLAIAKILNIEEIPVRINVRHKEWQQLRDSIHQQNRTINHGQQKHPDLQL